MQSLKRGFTLIELLVVIAIIGILSTLVITQLGNARGKARNSTAKNDVTEAGKAIELFKNDDAASDQVIGLATGDTSYTLDNEGTGAAIVAMFTGTQLVDTAAATSTYGVKLAKTPSASHTYTYDAAANVGGAGRLLVDGDCYAFQSSLDTGTGTGNDDGFFWVNETGNGSDDAGESC